MDFSVVLVWGRLLPLQPSHSRSSTAGVPVVRTQVFSWEVAGPKETEVRTWGRWDVVGRLFLNRTRLCPNTAGFGSPWRPWSPRYHQADPEQLGKVPGWVQWVLCALLEDLLRLFQKSVPVRVLGLTGAAASEPPRARRRRCYTVTQAAEAGQSPRFAPEAPSGAWTRGSQLAARRLPAPQASPSCLYSNIKCAFGKFPGFFLSCFLCSVSI